MTLPAMEPGPVEIDGSHGEGGGQILRTSLALAMLTRRPLVMRAIRAGRAKPGLRRQHLTCVEAAAALCHAKVTGARVGSQELAFEPGEPADHEDLTFDIGTAGSTTLVLQTILVPALAAGRALRVTVVGGTHNPMAPPFEFVQRCFGRALAAMGAPVDLQLVRHGFAPAGGGVLAAAVAPARLQPLQLHRWEPAALPRARVLLAGLPAHVAERELAVVRRHCHALGLHPEQCTVEPVAADGPGNALLLEFPGRVVDEVVAVAGERGLPAEQVAERAVAQALAFVAAGVPVGEHLADQLLVPLAIAGGGSFRTLPPTSHTRTCAAIVERFAPVRITLRAEGDPAGSWRIEVRPR